MNKDPYFPRGHNGSTLSLVVFATAASGQWVQIPRLDSSFLRAVEADLIEHTGGVPTTTQKILIHRCARLVLRLDVFDERLTDGEMTSHDAH
jgi:hypothetical protein